MIKNKFDIVIPVAVKNVELLKKIVIPYCKKHLLCDRIFIICSNNCRYLLENIPEIILIDEDCVVVGLSIASIKEQFQKITGNTTRAGWYFQQFLKMGWALYTDRTYYLVWDADTIPFRDIDFFSATGTVLFTPKTEFNKAYFETIEKLFQGRIEKISPHSFIAEHMMINSQFMRNMIAEIESNSELPGKIFFEKILNAININDLNKSGFSEFETYGNYVFLYHNTNCCFRKLKTFRYGNEFFGMTPDEKQLEWASHCYDTMSIEHHNFFIIKFLMGVRVLWNISRCCGVPMVVLSLPYSKIRDFCKFKFIYKLLRIKI